MKGGFLPSLLASVVPLTLLVLTRQSLGCTVVLCEPLSISHSYGDCPCGPATLGLDQIVPPLSSIENGSMSVLHQRT